VGISGLVAVVAAIDAAAHDDHALELAERGRVALDGRLNIDERTDGDEGNAAGMEANLAEQETDSVAVLALGLLVRIGGLVNTFFASVAGPANTGTSLRPTAAR